MRCRSRKHFAAILAMSIAGCDDDPSGPATPVVPSAVIVTVSANQTRFSLRNPLRLNVTVENRSTLPVVFGYGSSTCWLWFEAFHEGIETSIGGGRACSADDVLRGLDPGGSRTEWFTLDGVVSDWPPTPQLAAPGIYEIRGVIVDYTSEPIEVEYYIDP